MKDIRNYINGKWCKAVGGETFAKINPHNGEALCRVARSGEKDAESAIAAAKAAQPAWSDQTVVARGDLLRAVALRIRERRVDLIAAVAEEMGKAPKLAAGEADAAIEMGMFIAGEGRRYYGRTTTASMAHRSVTVVRQPLGVAGLIISFNTPFPNIAWKVFPALLCGNAAVLKPSEETPLSARLFCEICHEIGIPPGVINVVHGFGKEVGAPMVESPDVALISFTGSAETGRWIQETAGRRLAKVCMELGGKNALVVCDDADMDNAVNWTIQAAFSNAGQRCAAASRIVVFDAVYERFRNALVAATQKLKIGSTDDSDCGPVINEAAIKRLTSAVQDAVGRGGKVLCGGDRLRDEEHAGGFYMAPTLMEGVAADAPISRNELFGPVAVLYRVSDFAAALALVNDCPYGLTASIHTASLHRAMRFADKVQAGVVVVNGGTHGSEPHMGFGGVKNSGTGWREAGVEALDVYSDWKYINLIIDPGKV